MGFGQAISHNLSNMTNFSGRAGRPEFWWWILALWVLQLIVNLLTGGLTGGLQQFAGASNDPDQRYATKVLAEKQRLEQAVLRLRAT